MEMSLVAPVKDGKIQDVSASGTSNSTEKEKKTGSSSLDKQAFLQLLVAQMKYQDPLEPTSNTEYISQLATFSSLEEMQNMRSSMDLQRASSLVGQEVYMKTTNATTGDTDYVHGIVDYVTYENGKAFLSINGSLYPLDDLDSVYNQEYTEAYSMAYDFTVALNKLPSASKLTVSNFEDVEKLQKTYESMSDYQKGYLTSDNKKKIEELIAKMNEMKKAIEEAENAQGSSSTSGTENEDKTSSAEKTENTDEISSAEETESSDETSSAEETGNTDKTSSETEAADETSSTEGSDEAEAVAEETGSTEGEESGEGTE